MATTSNAPAPTSNSRNWLRRVTPRDVSPKWFILQMGASAAAIVIIYLGLVMSNVGDTLDLQYGLFLDRWMYFILLGSVIMTAIPAILAVKAKNWLRLVPLLVMLLVTSPLLFPYIMLLFTGFGKVLALLVFPIFLGPILHAIAVYWVGFQGMASNQVGGVQQELDRRRQVASETHARADALQGEADQANVAVKATEKRVTTAEKDLKKAQTDAGDARKAHDAYLKTDTSLSDAEREFGHAERELAARDKAVTFAHEQLMKTPTDNRNYEKLQENYENKRDAHTEYLLGDYQVASDKLDAAKRAADSAPTAQAKERAEKAEQDRSTELHDLKDQLATDKKVLAEKQASVGATVKAAKKADTAVTKVQEKLDAARASHSGQRNTWLLVGGALFLATLLCYAAAWGDVVNRVA